MSELRCNECDLLLTDHGERLASAVFDSLYPVKIMTDDDVMYAHCCTCYMALVAAG